MRMNAIVALLVVAGASAHGAPNKQATPPTRNTAAQVQRDIAGNRLEPLPRRAANTDDDAPRTICTPAPRFCVRAVTARHSGTSVVEVLQDRSIALIASMEFAAGGDHAVLKPWPFVVRLAEPDAMLLGMTEDTSTGYSGGGGSSSTLTLLRVARDGPNRTWTMRGVLTLPLSGYKMIRACFSEADMRARRQACHDEYSYDTKFTLVPTTARGKPRFAIATTATTFPGDVSPNRDSLRAEPLRKSDLAKGRDSRCSFRRILTANGAWDYLPDAPLPDCTGYLVD